MINTVIDKFINRLDVDIKLQHQLGWDMISWTMTRSEAILLRILLNQLKDEMEKNKDGKNEMEKQ